MKQSEQMKMAAEIMELLESKNLTTDETFEVVSFVYGKLAVAKALEEQFNKKENNPFGAILDGTKTRN